MELKQCKINGVDVLQNGASSGLFYSQTNWTKLVTRDSQQTYDGKHGRFVSPTYVSTRQIILEGLVDRLGNTGEQDAVEHLESMFNLGATSFPGATLSCYIKDPYDREWTMDVKIKEQLTIEPFSEDFLDYAYKWRVVLETIKDPFARGLNDIIVAGDEGEYGGFEMEFTLEDAWDDYINIIQCNAYNSNVPVYPKFEITVTGTINTPLTIKDITTEKYFALNIGAVAGDVIVIDMYNHTATKNGVNIIGTRIAGSQWLSISGVAYYAIQDIDGYIDTDDFNVNVIYKETIL